MNGFTYSCRGFLLSTILFFLCACATSQSPQPQKNLPMSAMDPLSMEILSRITQHNSRLNSFKGLGDIKLSQSQGKISLRLALSGFDPDRLRIAVMDISGRVIETFAYDGTYVYLQSHDGSHPLMKKKNSPKILEKLIAIPLIPEDVIGLVTGRPWLGHYDKATAKVLSDNRKQLDLFIRKKLVATILISPDDKIMTIEKYAKKSMPLYKVSFLSYASQSSFNLPSSVLIENNDGASCRIELKKYWPNANPPLDIFILHEGIR